MAFLAVGVLCGVLALLVALCEVRRARRDQKQRFTVVEDKRGELHVKPVFTTFGEQVRATSRAMTELGSQLTWGSPSVEEWRRRCEKSTELSRRRRGQA